MPDSEIKMEKIMIKTKTVGDFLEPEEIKNYHKQWNDFLSFEGNVLEDYRNVIKNPEHVIIGRVWQYKDYHLYRAKVLPNRLSWIIMDPPQPIWHEYHYWQAFEQIGQSLRRKYFKQINCKLVAKAKTPIVHFDLKKEINLDQRVSIEVIPEIYMRGKNENILTIENNYCAFYNMKNEILGRMYVKIFGTLRDYEILFEKMRKGESGAKEKFIIKIKSQERKLKKVGRLPKISVTELIKHLETNLYDSVLYNEIKDFFSLWNLE